MVFIAEHHFNHGYRAHKARFTSRTRDAAHPTGVTMHVRTSHPHRALIHALRLAAIRRLTPNDISDSSDEVEVQTDNRGPWSSDALGDDSEALADSSEPSIDSESPNVPEGQALPAPLPPPLISAEAAIPQRTLWPRVMPTMTTMV